MNSAKQQSDFFKRHLECPICLEVKRGCHIFQCNNGHIACSDCYAKLTQCPECRVAFKRPGIRNIRLEQLIDGLPAQCKYFEAGCSFETTEGNDVRTKHESDCMYILVTCPHIACDKKVSLAHLEDHVVSHHKTKRIESSSANQFTVEWPVNISFKSKQWDLILVLLNGIMFFPILFKKHNIYYVWLKAASNLQGQIETRLEGDTGTQKLTGRYFDINTQIDYIATIPEKVLTLSNSQAKQFMAKDSQGQNLLKVTFKLLGGLAETLPKDREKGRTKKMCSAFSNRLNNTNL
jgi:hypothetical protein